jgi:hypothetical protein
MLSYIVSTAGCTLVGVGESGKWRDIILARTQARLICCKFLNRKQLFGTLYFVYIITVSELRVVLQSCAQHRNNRGLEKVPDPTTTTESSEYLRSNEILQWWISGQSSQRLCYSAGAET